MIFHLSIDKKGEFSMFKSKKPLTTPIILAIAGAVAGLFLLLRPGATLGTVIRIAGWALILDGAIKAVQLFLSGKRKLNDYVMPAAQVIFGVLFMIIARFLLKLIPIVVGLALIALGAYKIKTALDLKKKSASDKKWIVILALSALSAVIGIYVLCHPSGFTNTVIRILGAYLLIECAEDLYAYFIA